MHVVTSHNLTFVVEGSSEADIQFKALRVAERFFDGSVILDVDTEPDGTEEIGVDGPIWFVGTCKARKRGG